MKRIEMRDRPYERDMDVEYIDLVNQTYEKHYTKTDGIPPVLNIDTNETNIVTRSDHLLVVEDQIRRALKLAPYQHTMPI
jgi:deoxyguanosine kinase